MKYLPFLILLIGCAAPKESVKEIVTVHHDTLISKEIHKDSVIHNIYSKDTVFIHENKLTVKYVYKGGDSAFIGGRVLPDTVIKVHYDTTRITTVVKEVAKPLDGFDNFCRWAVILTLIGLALYFGGKALLPLLKSKIP